MEQELNDEMYNDIAPGTQHVELQHRNQMKKENDDLEALEKKIFLHSKI